MPAMLAEVPASATLLVEVRNREGDLEVFAGGRNANFAPQLALPLGQPDAVDAGEWRKEVGPYASNGTKTALYCLARAAAGKKGSVEVRISLYEGSYAGPYLPWWWGR